MLNDTDTYFKMLADSTRLRCLLLMQAEGELCVCELTHALNLSQPKISRHLAYLREAGLVSVRRQGLWMFYRVREGLPLWCQTVLGTTVEGIRHEAPYVEDLARLTKVADRPDGACLN